MGLIGCSFHASFQAFKPYLDSDAGGRKVYKDKKAECEYNQANPPPEVVAEVEVVAGGLVAKVRVVRGGCECVFSCLLLDSLDLFLFIYSTPGMHIMEIQSFPVRIVLPPFDTPATLFVRA